MFDLQTLEEAIEADDLPKSNYKAPPVIPKEDYGEGCNNRVYYACNEGTMVYYLLGGCIFLSLKLNVDSLSVVSEKLEILGGRGGKSVTVATLLSFFIISSSVINIQIFSECLIYIFRQLLLITTLFLSWLIMASSSTCHPATNSCS